MKAFELQAYRNGKWLILGVFNDYELAQHEAKRVEESKRYPSFRIIEEVYNEATNMTRTRTLFQGGHANDREEDDVEREREARMARRRDRLRAATAKVATLNAERRRRRREVSAVLVPILVLSIIVLSGLLAMISLQNLFRQL